MSSKGYTYICHLYLILFGLFPKQKNSVNTKSSSPIYTLRLHVIYLKKYCKYDNAYLHLLSVKQYGTNLLYYFGNSVSLPTKCAVSFALGDSTEISAAGVSQACRSRSVRASGTENVQGV